MTCRRLIWASSWATLVLAISCASAQAASSNGYISQFNGSATAGKSMEPRSLAVNSSGDVYVGDSENDVVDKFNPSGTTVLAEFNGGLTKAGSFRPFSLAVNSSGDVYVGDAENGVVDEFNSSGTTVLAEFNGGLTKAGSFRPQSLAVNSSGDVYVGDAENGVVDEFNSSGTTVLAEFNGGLTKATSFSPYSLAVDSSGDVYVGDREHNVLDEFNASGTTVLAENTGSETLQKAFESLGAIAIAPNGQIYVSTTEIKNVVDRFSSTGTYECQINGSASTEQCGGAASQTPQGSFEPRGLAVGPSEDLYVGDVSNAVVDIFSASTPITEYPLTVTKEGSGAAEGTVTSTPAGIECGATCTHEFAEGKTVTLTEHAEGTNFEGWTEGCESEPTPEECVLTVNSTKEVKAKFTAVVLEEFQLEVSVTGGGEVTSTGTVACKESSGVCLENAKETKPVTLSAHNAPGWKFKKWSGVTCEGGSNTSETCSFKMPKAATEVKAEYEPTHEFSLNVFVTGEGEVTSNPGGITACGPLGGAECSHPFEGAVTLTATPKKESGYVFVGWLGCKRATATTCDVDVTDESEVTAVFLKEGKVGEEGKEGKQGNEGKEGPEGETGLTGPAGEKGAQGERGAAGANGFNGAEGAPGPAGPAGPQGPAGKQGPPGKIEIVTCKKVKRKQRCTTRTVSGTVTFTARSARAMVSRDGVVYAAGTAHTTSGRMHLRLVPLRKLRRGHYTLTVISGAGRHETIRNQSFTLS